MRLQLFPQVLSDLNFFNVSSEEELALRLRTVQRVAVAAIGLCLLFRFEPTVFAKLASYAPALVNWRGYDIFHAAVKVAMPVPFMLLSCPSAALVMGVWWSRCGVSWVVLGFGNRNISAKVSGVILIVGGYWLSQIYKNGANNGIDVDTPNLLETVFQKVENKCTKPLWDRFYAKKNRFFSSHNVPAKR